MMLDLGPAAIGHSLTPCGSPLMHGTEPPNDDYYAGLPLFLPFINRINESVLYLLHHVPLFIFMFLPHHVLLLSFYLCFLFH
jgi:hypothetical protein